MENYGFKLYFVAICVSYAGNSTLNEVYKVGTMLFESLSYQSPSEDFLPQGKPVVGLYEYEERATTLIREKIDVNSFEKVVNDLASQFSWPSIMKKEILRGKQFKKSEKVHGVFDFRIGETGKFSYGRTITAKRNNGDELDFAYALYSIKLRPLKTKIVEKIAQSPIFDALFGKSNKISWAHKGLSSEAGNGYVAYLRNKAASSLLTDHLKTTNDPVTQRQIQRMLVANPKVILFKIDQTILFCEGGGLTPPK